MKQITTYITEKANFLVKKHITDKNPIVFSEPTSFDNIDSIDKGDWILLANVDTKTLNVLNIDECGIDGAGTKQSPKMFWTKGKYAVALNSEQAHVSLYGGKCEDRFFIGKNYIFEKWNDKYKNFVKTLLKTVNTNTIDNLKIFAKIGDVNQSLNIDIIERYKV